MFRQLTLGQAALRAAGLIAAAAAGVALGNKLLAVVGERLEGVNERLRSSSGLELLAGTALASVHRPATVLLPFWALFYSLLVGGAFAEVAAARLDAKLHTVTHVCAHQALGWLTRATQFMQDISEVVLIVFLAWWLIAWKAHLLRLVLAGLQSETGEGPELGRVLVPLSNLLSWAIVVCASVTILAAFGIDIRPLLTVGSISTVAVGFAAQSTMQNVVSALQIYSSRPFIVGDRIQLKSLSGSVIVAGTVEHIAPMRTVIRTPDKLPIFVNNKDVMSLMIANESKQPRNTVLPSQLVSATLTVRYQDVDALPAIERSITDYLCAHPDLQSARCVLKEFTTAGPQLSLSAVLARPAASRQAFVAAELLYGAEAIVRSHGAFLAIEEQLGQGLPPSPPPGAPTSSGEPARGGGSRR